MARRGGGRAAKASARQSKGVASFDKAWRQWVNPYPPICQFNDDEIEAIHEASLKVLKETGLRVLSPEACKLYKGAGHDVSPLLSDWSKFENWQDGGSLDATKRANLIYKETIKNF